MGTQNQTEPYPHQDRYVQALNIHPEFDGRNLHNDFAVLFTSEVQAPRFLHLCRRSQWQGHMQRRWRKPPCVPQNMTLTPTYRLVWLPGVLAVVRMEPQECMPLSVRLCDGYTSNVCQDWMNNKIADLEKKRDGAGKYGRIFE